MRNQSLMNQTIFPVHPGFKRTTEIILECGAVEELKIINVQEQQNIFVPVVILSTVQESIYNNP